MKIQSTKRQATNLFSEKELFLSESQHDLSDFIGIPFSKDAFQKQALITEEVLPLTKAELSRLRNRGVQYYLFDTPNKCNQMRNWFIQHANSRNFSKEEIAEIYRSIYSLTYSSPA